MLALLRASHQGVHYVDLSYHWWSELWSLDYVGVCQVYHKNHDYHLCSWLVFCGKIFGDNANTCSSLNFYPQTLTYVGTYLLNQPPVWWLPNSVFSIAIIPPTFISWLIKKAFPPLCIYSLIYICTNYWIHIFKSLMILLLFVLMFKLSQIWPLEPVQGGSFDMFP